MRTRTPFRLPPLLTGLLLSPPWIAPPNRPLTLDVPWLTLTPTSGTAPLTVTATVDRSGLEEGNYTATISITSATQEMVTVGVTIRVGGITLGNVGPVFVLVVEQETFETVEQTTTSVDQNYAFILPPVMPGTYRVVAGTDRDDNGLICEGEDACGFFPDPVTITTHQQGVSDIDFVIGELSAPQGLPTAFAAHRGRPFARLD